MPNSVCAQCAKPIGRFELKTMVEHFHYHATCWDRKKRQLESGSSAWVAFQSSNPTNFPRVRASAHRDHEDRSIVITWIGRS
jgi:hypothetical protein